MPFKELYTPGKTERILVTCALPYVNNMPHLGNLVPILSADVYSKYLELKQIPHIYICATDEHGTRTEIEAAKNKTDEETYCKKIHDEMSEIFNWFGVTFTHFGRTSAKPNHEITQDIFVRLDKNGFITEQQSEQFYCEQDKLYLPDTYVEGICPKCGFAQAKGDQCDKCGSLLNAVDLADPRCVLCHKTPVKKETKHLYLALDKLAPKLKKWIEDQKHWDGIIKNFPLGWINEGLLPRAITRDLKWGVKVPKQGYENQVFYVWFDAPVGYISATKEWTDAEKKDFKIWWKNRKTKVIHFLGKDNVPFHTILWPASLMGAEDSWNLPFYIASNEYLNYEGAAFSKSRGVGVFSQDIVKMKYPPDLWRLFVIVNRPERKDVEFTFERLQAFVNGSLIANFGNLVNRLFTFTHKRFGKIPPQHKLDKYDKQTFKEADETVREIEKSYADFELAKGAKLCLKLGDIINRYMTYREPWKTIKTDTAACETAIHNTFMMLHKLLYALWPITPSTSEQILDWMGSPLRQPFKAELPVANPTLLFEKIEDEEVEALCKKFAKGERFA